MSLAIVRRLLIAAAAFCVCACAPGGGSMRDRQTSEHALSMERVRADVAWLSDDARAGREAGSAGYRDAADYVARRFAQLGLVPGADGSWFQDVPLRVAVRDIAVAEAVIVRDGERAALRHFSDYLIGRPLGAASFDVTAPVVFVGHGVVDKESGHDDYAGVDVAGKIVAVFSGAPANFGSEKRAVYATTQRKHDLARARGAVGYVTLLSKSSERQRSWKRRIESPGAAGMTWVRSEGRTGAAAERLQATALLSARGAARLFEGAGARFEDLQEREDNGDRLHSFELGSALTLRGAARFSQVVSPNVVGMIEGADPALKKEVIVVTAHLDHIGVAPSASKNRDKIFNGALDNAMGIALLMDVARSAALTAPPRRTLVFAALTAEEKGLLGADYFARFPPLGERRMIANINLDMPLVLHAFTDVIAFGGEQSTLGDAVDAAARAVGLVLSPDPMPERVMFARSDQYRFMQQGVPSVLMFPGFANGGGDAFAKFMREHYHRPSDDMSLPIDFAAAVRFGELNFRVVDMVANAPTAPRWRQDSSFAGKSER